MDNNCPDNSGLAVLDLFTSTKEHALVKQIHTFGLPCFILDPKLCQKKSIPKWTLQSRQAVYIGILLQHAESVALVLNIKAGYISPQLHIVFGDNFIVTTLTIKNKLPDNWDDLFKNHCELPPEEFQFSIGKQWKTPIGCSEVDWKVNNNSPTDCSEVDCKVNNNSPTDCSEGDHKVNNISPTYRSKGDRKVNNNSPSDQTERANYCSF